MKQDIAILGGGVIGITTALVFHALGYEVEIICNHFLWEHSEDPTFASVYPAASVIPHNVGGDTRKLYTSSYALFAQVAHRYPDAVRKQKHLELTEGPFDEKPHYSWMDAQLVEEETFPWGILIPRRAKSQAVRGVGFDIFFVEMPLYILLLKDLVQRHAIKVTRKQIDVDTLQEIANQHTMICNCLGINGPALVEDEALMEGVAGILVRYPVSSLFKNTCTNTPISYNYLFEGVEVYAYPRSKDLVFGGIRIPVDTQKSPLPQLRAHFDAQGIAYTYMQGVPVPDYLVRVNKEINEQLYEIDIQTQEAAVQVGVRPVRQGGVRLDTGTLGASLLVNSYGYGGAGVTLSWGAAVQAARLVDAQLDEKMVIAKIRRLL